MQIHNLYEDENGESHWRDIEVEWTEMTPGGPATGCGHASGVIFRQMPTTYDLDWHPAPRKQYVIHLDGEGAITASDGETRIVKPGEIMLLEDVNGRGHRSKNVSGHPYHVVFVALDGTGVEEDRCGSTTCTRTKTASPTGVTSRSSGSRRGASASSRHAFPSPG